MKPIDEKLKSRWATVDGQSRMAAIREAIASAHSWDSFLFDIPCTGKDVTKDLRGADLSKIFTCSANLNKVDLSGANLTEARLISTSFVETILRHANLNRAILKVSEFGKSDLRGADLRGADLGWANLNDANLTKANLSDANLCGAKLHKANLTGANLHNANLETTQLNKANLTGADLNAATLSSADLSEANFTKADLSNADLSRAYLNRTCLDHATLLRTNLTGCHLVNSSLKGANLSYAIVFGVSAWGIDVDSRTKQNNLIITEGSEAQITMDDIRVAQFIYLLLNNKNIRDVIDKITSKVVLILGRFTQERMAVLDAIRAELRVRGYCPVLFDFEKPATRDITETVSTLAHMARFVIADLTDPRSIPHELMSFAEKLPSVAVQPLILKGQREYGMFEHFKRYPWVLPVHEYTDHASLITDIGATIIDPAETKVRELMRSNP